MSRYLQSKNFCRDRRGNVAMLFGLMAVPVLGVVGTAIDYGRAAKTKQELQSLIDGAALAATSEYTKTGDASTASTRLRSFVENGLAKHNLSLLPPAQPGENPPTLGADTTKVLLENADFDGENATVSPKLTARVATTLLALVDQPYFEIEAATKAGLAGKKLELSMMLDITGSMCDSNNQPCSSGVKLTGMKNAAKDLLDIIFTGNGANTRVAIVLDRRVDPVDRDRIDVSRRASEGAEPVVRHHILVEGGDRAPAAARQDQAGHRPRRTRAAATRSGTRARWAG